MREHFPGVRVLELGANTGFAGAANARAAGRRDGLRGAGEHRRGLEPDWLERTCAVLEAAPQAASVATKMLDLEDPSLIYDTGDILRRDGACEQRGRFPRDDGRFDQPGEVFGACAGAALYRRAAALELGGFDERFFLYLEDVDLALRLRLAGWTCMYEPAVALHAGEGSGAPPERPVNAWAERNTLLLVARAFPWSWLPLVLWRQAGWAWHALRGRRLAPTCAAPCPRCRCSLRCGANAAALRAAPVPIEQVVPPHPLRGPYAPSTSSRTAARKRSGE